MKHLKKKCRQKMGFCRRFYHVRYALVLVLYGKRAGHYDIVFLKEIFCGSEEKNFVRCFLTGGSAAFSRKKACPLRPFLHVNSTQPKFATLNDAMSMHKKSRLCLPEKTGTASPAQPMTVRRLFSASQRAVRVGPGACGKRSIVDTTNAICYNL